MKSVVFAGLRLATRPGEVVPFEVPCVCGHVLRGQRQSQHQVVRCPACAADRFILPRSPLPRALSDASSTITTRSRARFWLLPAAAAGLALAVAVGGVLAVLNYTRTPTGPGTSRPASDEERFQQHLEAGRTAMTGREYHLAARELSAALELGDRKPGRWTAAERRQAAQQRRQAALIADMLPVSLADVARHAGSMSDAEWQLAYQQRYAGRAVLLDDVIHVDAQHQFHHAHRFRVADVPLRIDLKRLRLLEDLAHAFGRPQRVLLGLRLAGIRHDPAEWVVLPELDSGVLITDPGVIAGLSLPEEKELLEVVARQRTWLDQLQP